MARFIAFISDSGINIIVYCEHYLVLMTNKAESVDLRIDNSDRLHFIYSE